MSSRSLHESDMALILITQLANGDLTGNNEAENIGFSLFEVFTKPFSTLDPENAAKSFLMLIQESLMARRKDDFITIQKEPAFGKKCKNNFIELLKSYRQGGKDLLKEKYSELITAVNKTTDDVLVEYTGGTGISIDEAIRIHTSDHDLGIAAEYWYLNYAFGRIEKQSQSQVQGDDGKYYDQINFKISDGREIWVYFDISDFYTGYK